MPVRNRDCARRFRTHGRARAQFTVAGVCLGLGGSIALTRAMASLVVGLTTWDPLVFVSVAALLALVSLAAAYIPARDAARIDPLRALRVS